MLHVSLAGPKGFEPSTSSVTSSRSNQLELQPRVIVHQPEFESGRTTYQIVMLTITSPVVNFIFSASPACRPQLLGFSVRSNHWIWIERPSF